jgi:DNA-binding response OmpR family regulator
MTKILIIEDDAIIAKGLVQAFSNSGYTVVIAKDGEEGLEKVRSESPDLIILDIMMPHLNGFEVATELRRKGNAIPIIILSARVDSRDKVRGLDLGADDYVVKPFDLDELLARVRRLLNRGMEHTDEFGPFQYSWKTRNLIETHSGKAHMLSAKERKVLEFLLKRKGQIVTREQLLDGVWGDDYDGTDRTVDNVIVSLRKKIGSNYLVTERSIGYRFVTNP